MPSDFSRPRAVLRTIADLSGDSYRDVDGKQLIAALADQGTEVAGIGLYNLMHRLRDDGYLTFAGGAGMSVERMQLIRLDARGRQEVEGWPTIPGTLPAADVEALIATLDARADDESTDEDERSKLRALASTLRDLGVSVSGPLLVAWFKSIGVA